MANYAALKTELMSDPLARGYAGMTHQQAADSLNTANRTQDRSRMESTEVFQAIVVAEFNALTERQKSNIMGILGFGVVDPFGKEADVFVDHFGAGSSTIQALAGLRRKSVTRAQELGIFADPTRQVLASHVAAARAA